MIFKFGSESIVQPCAAQQDDKDVNPYMGMNPMLRKFMGG